MKKSEKEQLEKVMQRLESGELVDQACWSFIKELNSYSEERLESIAIRDGYRTYTYRQMFRYWERYAEAFSGVDITARNHSRAALIGTPLTETVFAFYGLNMAGASVSLIYPFDLFDDKQIESMIEREQITDLIVSELYAFPKLMKRLLLNKERLGLNNIIVLGSPMGGEFGVPALELVRNTNRELFRELEGGLLMEDLLNQYEAYPVAYSKGKSDVVLHTTGTVSGMHKPVPMTDKAMNAFVVTAMKAKETYKDFEKAPKHMVTYLTLNMSWVYAMVDMLHTPLGLGMEIVSLPVGATNPRYSEAIQHYGINVLFTSKNILDSWLKTMPDIDLSKLKIVFMGGTYVSPDYKKQFNDYLKSCGSTARIINGYGLSELGGACLLCPSTREDDAIGFLLPGFQAKIYVEDEDLCYDISDGPRTGVLLLRSETMSTGRLGDTVFFELDQVDDDEYFNTHDLVRVNEDGSLTCIGRSNQYFVNNAGVRFDAGLVENAITSQPGIVACGLAPEFQKMLHDNVPVLYAEMSEKGAGAVGTLRKALIQAFIKDGVLADTNLPSQCVIVETIPLNSSGKVDARKLASGTVTGSRYSVKPVWMEDKVVDILLVPAAEGENATNGAGVPEELRGDPYTILSEVFAAIPDLNKGRYSRLFKIPGLREMVMKLTGFDMNNIPASVRNMTPTMFNLAYRKYMMPLMKGVNTMSKQKKNTPNAFGTMFQGMKPMMPPMMPPMPFMPGMGWFGKKDNVKEKENSVVENIKSKAGNLKSSIPTYWDKMIEMQKSTMEASRDQYNQFFEHMMDMEDTFASSLSEDAISLLGIAAFAMSPKEFMNWVKQFQEARNAYFVERVDAQFNFFFKKQEQVREMVDSAAKNGTKKKEDAEKAEAEQDEAAEE